MRIILNGNSTVTDKKTAFELCNPENSKNKIVIVNGFQINKNERIKDGDTIIVIEKDRLPSYDELEMMMAARHTPMIHEKLKKGKVAIAGLGGLGSNVAIMLARIGVGNLLLVDFDIVEPSNLNRQSYAQKHLGLYKTEAILDQIREINPFIHVKIHTEKVTYQNAEALFHDYDIICEAFDTPESKAMLADVILSGSSGKKLVSASGMAGYHSANAIKTVHRMKNFYLCGDFETEACIGTGLMAPRVQICAGHQANMILRLLIGIEDV